MLSATWIALGSLSCLSAEKNAALSHGRPDFLVALPILLPCLSPFELRMEPLSVATETARAENLHTTERYRAGHEKQEYAIACGAWAPPLLSRQDQTGGSGWIGAVQDEAGVRPLCAYSRHPTRRQREPEAVASSWTIKSTSDADRRAMIIDPSYYFG